MCDHIASIFRALWNVGAFMKVIATNKKAYHKYNLMEKFECGLVLIGPEVKSVRAAQVSFTDSFAFVDKDALMLYNVHINPYEQASYNNVEPARPRRLLLHKKEMERLKGLIARQGLTIIPTKIYFNSRGYAKVEVALAEGKKQFDKREDIKNRDIKRDIARRLKS